MPDAMFLLTATPIQCIGGTDPTVVAGWLMSGSMSLIHSTPSLGRRSTIGLGLKKRPTKGRSEMNSRSRCSIRIRAARVLNPEGITRRIRYGEPKIDYSDIFSVYPFECFGTLTFKYPVTQDTARKRLVEWIRALCVRESLQIACLAVLNWEDRVHWHVLMLGRSASGKTLRNVPIENCNDGWGPYKLSDKAKVEFIRDRIAVSKYMSKNLATRDPGSAELFCYNKKLLKRCGHQESPLIDQALLVSKSEKKGGDNTRVRNKGHPETVSSAEEIREELTEYSTMEVRNGKVKVCKVLRQASFMAAQVWFVKPMGFPRLSSPARLRPIHGDMASSD